MPLVRPETVLEARLALLQGQGLWIQMLRELTQLLNTIDYGWKTSARHATYKRHRHALIRAVLRADLLLGQDEGACEGSLEDLSCEETDYGNDLRGMLTELLGRQPLNGSKPLKQRTKDGKQSALNRSSHT